MERRYSYSFGIVDKVSAPVRRIGGAFAAANLRMQSFGQGIEAQGQRLGRFGNSLVSLKGLLLGSFVTAGITSLGRELIGTLGKFETFEAVLTNTLGSNSAAKQVLGDIEEFASRTPFQVDQLTDSWVRLANQGFRPSMDEMTSLGDLASSTGKGIDQLAEAVIDAQVGEFERLKEFGIRASKSGDQVKFAFKGQETQVAFTQDAIQDYLLSLGKMEGVGGSMAAISETIAGKTSNLQDRLTALSKTFAEAVRPALITVIDIGSKWVGRLTELSKWVEVNRVQVWAWTKVIGGVAAAFVGVALAIRTVAGIQAMVASIAAGWAILTKVVTIARTAVMAFNFVAMMNPFGWIALAIGGAVLLISQFDGVKKFFVGLSNWMRLNHPFTWIIELVDRIFPGFKDATVRLFEQVKNAIGKAFKWLSDKVFKPFSGILEKLFGFKGVSSLAMTPFVDPAADNGSSSPYGRTTSGSSTTSGGGGGGGGGNAINQRLSSVESGGGKHITINIDALNKGGITVQSTTLGASVEQIRDELTRMLLSVVNDVNYQ